jgi:hypothetical protein
MLLLQRGSIQKHLTVEYQMQVAIQLLIGTVACGVLILLARRLEAERELRLYALSLVIAALVYVGFTLRGATLRWLALELAGSSCSRSWRGWD